MSNIDNKLQIYKMRVSTLIEEHADAVSQAQDLHRQLQEANEKISQLEEQVRNNNVQKERKDPSFVIDHDVVSTKK